MPIKKVKLKVLVDTYVWNACIRKIKSYEKKEEYKKECRGGNPCT